MSLPEQLLLSDLLRRRVRCDQGIDHGAGVLAWMHPPVHRLLGWISKASAFGDRREAWRLDQLRGLGELEALVQGPGADTDLPTVDRLPTLIDAAVLDRRGEVIGTMADAAVELSTGRILHYLVSRSDPRLPGSSRWRLSPERISDQQSGQVFTELNGLDDLPLARASVRQEFLRRGRRWRDQFQEETERLRDQFQQAGDRFEERLEGWMEEEPIWDRRDSGDDRDALFENDASAPVRSAPSSDQETWDDWDQPSRGTWTDSPRRSARHQPSDEDPWL